MVKEERLELRLDADLKAWLSEASDRANVSVATVVRRAVDYYRRRSLFELPSLDRGLWREWNVEGMSGMRYEEGRVDILLVRDPNAGYRCRIRVSYDGEWPGTSLQSSFERGEKKLLELRFISEHDSTKEFSSVIGFLEEWWDGARTTPIDQFGWVSLSTKFEVI